MVVIAIMVILTAIVVPSYRIMHAQSERNTCAANLKAIGQALALFREDYQCFPPDSTEYLRLPADPNKLADNPADVIHAAYDPQTLQPINTGVHGLGLYTLYYLGIYSAALPPVSLEPKERLGENLRRELSTPLRRPSSNQLTVKGLNGLLWFRSGGYLTKLDLFHCPANPAKLNDADLANRSRLPDLGGWGNYDTYYRRNQWYPGTMSLPMVGDVPENRHLLQPYPPADTVVCWCTYHRTAKPPRNRDTAAPVLPGDKDLVLFADGSVRRMTSRADNQMYREAPGDAGWPSGPVM